MADDVPANPWGWQSQSIFRNQPGFDGWSKPCALDCGRGLNFTGNNPITMPFKPGQSGNPRGRPKVDVHIRDLARKCSPEAIKTLESIMKDKDEAASARVSAACAILDRGYGKPDQHSTVDVLKHDATDWTRDELVALLHDARAGSARAATANGRDHEPDKLH